jgi:hypothetical protein
MPARICGGRGGMRVEGVGVDGLVVGIGDVVES